MNFVELLSVESNSSESVIEKICPSKIVCIGRNYLEHAKELGNEAPTEPVIFIKPNSAISRVLKTSDEIVHYETELCFLVKNNTLVAAGLGLDLTKRQVQSRLKEKGLPWERAKSFDGSALFSQFVSFEEWRNLSFSLTVNDTLTQEGDPSLMQFNPQNILEECQTFLSFEDGDIIMTGTPKGVGEILKGNKYTVRLFQDASLLLEYSWLAE